MAGHAHSHHSGPREWTNPLAYVPMAFIGLGVVVFVFASGYLRGVHEGKALELLESPYAEEAKPAVNVQALASVTATDLEQMIADGKTVYALNCASCHGPEGQGNGDKGIGLNPPPRNFHEGDPAVWYHGKNWSALWETLESGARGSMTPFRHLPPEDRAAVIHYISEWIPEQPELTPEEVATLPSGQGESGSSGLQPVEEPAESGPRVPLGYAMKEVLAVREGKGGTQENL